MNRTIEILFLLEDLCYGGTQRQMVELVRRLDRTRFRPTLLTLTGPTDLDDLVLQADIDLIHLGKTRAWAPFFFWKLGGVLRSIAPDILVPCTALPNIWGRIWGSLWRIPVVLGTCRGGGAPVRQHERWLWKLTSHMICNSEALRTVLQGHGVPYGHITYIPNGVDTLFFKPGVIPLSERSPLLLCVGRLAKDKDHLTLLRAFEEIVRISPNIRLRLVGDGPEEAVLKKWAAQHAVGRQVDFVPGTEDIRSHYADATVFVLASQREGQPNVILEAMSAGLPVCATGVGGIPRLVEHEVSGLLSPAGDAGALAANCLRLLQNSSLAADFGRAGRHKVEREHSFRVMVEAHQDIFEHLWQTYLKR